MSKYLVVIAFIFMTACSDTNDLPAYGEDSHLPANCRAYVQDSIDAYKSGQFTADETMQALERNCGLHGQLWSYKR